MFVHAVKNSVQPENYHFPRGHIYQGYHFRFFDAPGLVPPLAPGLMPLDFRQMPLDLSPPIKFGWGGPGGQPLDYY